MERSFMNNNFTKKEANDLLKKGLEEFEDKLEYIDIAEDRKEKYRELISKIKEEKEDSVKEYLFNELIKMLK